MLDSGTPDYGHYLIDAGRGAMSRHRYDRNGRQQPWKSDSAAPLAWGAARVVWATHVSGSRRGPGQLCLQESQCRGRALQRAPLAVRGSRLARRHHASVDLRTLVSPRAWALGRHRGAGRSRRRGSVRLVSSQGHLLRDHRPTGTGGARRRLGLDAPRGMGPSPGGLAARRHRHPSRSVGAAKGISTSGSLAWEIPPRPSMWLAVRLWNGGARG